MIFKRNIPGAEGQSSKTVVLKNPGNGRLLSALAVSLVLFALVCPVSKSATYFPLFASLAFALYIRIKNRDLFLQAGLKRLAWIGGALVIWQSATVFLNYNELSMSPFNRALPLLPVFALAGLNVDRQWKEQKIIISVFVFLSSTALTVLLGIYQKASGITYPLPVQPYADGALEGFFGYHIHAGGFLSTVGALTLSLILFWKTSRNNRLALIVLLTIFGAGVLFAISRTYYISSLVVTPLIFARKSLRHAVAGIALLLCIILAVLFFSPAIRDRSISIFDVKKNSSNVERLFLWKVARDMIADKPVTGVGFRRWGDNLYKYAGRYESEWKFTPAALHHAHNAYLNVAAETGLTGLLLFLGFWFYLLYLLFKAAFKAERDSFASALAVGVSFGIINLLIGGMFEENFVSTSINMFLISFLVSVTFFVACNRPGPQEQAIK